MKGDAYRERLILRNENIDWAKTRKIRKGA